MANKAKNSKIKLLAILGLGLYIGSKLKSAGKKPQKTRIKNIYHYWARIYDSFLKYWNKSIARSAEKYLNEFLDKNLGKKITVLDLACGTGQNITRLKNLKKKVAKYVAVDLTPEMQDKAKEKAGWIKNQEFILGDVMEFKTEQKFDLIICTWALSHMLQPERFLEKYLKHINKGGVFALIFQGEFEKAGILNTILNPLQKFFQAKMVSSQAIEDVMKKASLDKKYWGGYVRLLIFKN